jgi:hypothetical protein
MEEAEVRVLPCDDEESVVWSVMSRGVAGFRDVHLQSGEGTVVVECVNFGIRNYVIEGRGGLV